MRPEDLDQIFARAGAEHQVEPELLDRISGAIVPGLQAVRPMASVKVTVLGLYLVCIAVALAGASVFGLYGKSKSGEVVIASAMAWFALLAAKQSAAEMVPGSRRVVNPAVLVCAGCAALIAVFALLLSGYAMDGFVQRGVPCLRAGLLVALPAGGGTWLMLRRGLAVNPASAGMSAGTLAGLAGVMMLELHCPILRAIHVIAWHVAVVPVSALVGALLARVLTSRG